MVFADVWSAVGGVASIVAAVAALVTIVFARETVREAKTARAEAHHDHLVAIDHERDASEAAATAHREEMTERRRALEAEQALQRALQVQRIADSLLELVTVAREEHFRPPPVISDGHPFPATRIPTMVIRLRGALGFLHALGGPKLKSTATLVDERQTGENPITTLGMAVDALSEIGNAAGADASLRVTPDGASRST